MRFSALKILQEGLTGNKGWTPHWRDPAPRPEYDAIIIGGGGHGLATAYYLAKNHGIRNVAVLEKGYLGGGNVGRNTTIVRANYGLPGNSEFYSHSLKLWEGLEEDLNYNVMHSQRGIINLFHSDGARDAAALALLAGTGIRRAEAVALDLADFDLEDGSVRVLGKGDKERQVYLVDGARSAIAWWLGLRGSEPGPLLYRVLKGGHIRPRRLEPAAIGIVVERRVREVGLRHTTPHDFRRTFTGDLLDAGADLSSAQALLGHASPTTTARYDRRGERARRKAAELVKVPFGRGGGGSGPP